MERHQNLHVFVVNGYPRSGKDTFVDLIREETKDQKVRVYCYSSVQTAKDLYQIFGWDGEKRPIDRDRLSMAKDYLQRFDLPYRDMACKLRDHLIEAEDRSKEMILIFFMIREPEEIKRFVKEFPFVRTIYVDAEVRGIAPSRGGIGANHADAEVIEYSYDMMVNNNGTLDDLKHEVQHFLCSLTKGVK